jgi:hypothetical protein
VTAPAPPGTPLVDIIGVRRDPDRRQEGPTFITQLQIWEDQLDDALAVLTNDAGEEGNQFFEFADCAWDAFKNHFRLSAAAGTSGIFAAPIPKRVVPPYRQIGSPTTNLLSVLGHFAEVNIPRVSIAGRATTNLLRVAGRVNPYLAVGLAVVDAAVIAKDAADCYQQKKDGKK